MRRQDGEQKGGLGALARLPALGAPAERLLEGLVLRHRVEGLALLPLGRLDDRGNELHQEISRLKKT